MNSRQRIVNALRRQPVDHPPLWLRFWPLGEEDRLPLPWREQTKRAEYLLGIGVDDVLMLEPPLGYVENYRPERLQGVTSHVESRRESGETILVKTYETSLGALVQAVRKSEDWAQGDDIRMFDDFNIPRQAQPLIQDADDLKKLPLLLGQPAEDDLRAFREAAGQMRDTARRLGVAVEGGMTALGDAAVWLCGMMRVLTAQMDEPAFLEELLDILLEWELRRVDWLLAEDVDFITHMAWYEGTDFWTPRSYRRLLKPRLKRIIDRVHQAGKPFRYIVTKGWLPLMQDLIDLQIDCLAGVDPVQGQADLRAAKDTLGKRMCLMGGVNSAVALTQWDEAAIRASVGEAFRILAPGGGFILYPVDAIFSNFDWQKVLALIDEWKAQCSRFRASSFV